MILDTRSDGEYCGTTVRAKRGGAVPGRRAHRVDAQPRARRRRSSRPPSCRQMYEAAGVTPDREVITYCQGGYRAAHAYLALRLLGYPRVRNYVGSWKEWGDREDLPIEVRSSQVSQLSAYPRSGPSCHCTELTLRPHEQRHRLHQHQPRPLRRRAEGVPRHSQHQRAARSTPATCARCAEWTRRRDAPHRAAERAADRDARQSGRLRRLARRRGRADDPVLRPLRRAAGRSARAVGIAAVRGDRARRRDLRARLGRRQGPGLHALQGHRGAPEAERPAAGEHEDHPRGRGGGRLREPRRLHQATTRPSSPPTSS